MSSTMQRHLDALKDRPHDSQVLGALGELLGARDSLSADERGLLDDVRGELRQSGDWSALVGLIDAELPVADSERQAELLGLKGRVLEEELLDEGAAVEAFKAALELRPDDEEMLDTVEHIEMMRENWQRIADKYIEEAEAATDRQLSTSLLLSAAEVIWRNEPGSARIEECLKRSLEVEPRNRKASGHLERLLRAQGRFEELAALLDTRSSVAATQPERVAALLGLGDLWAGDVAVRSEAETADAAAERDEQPVEADRAKAVDYYRRALSLDAGCDRALRRLVELLTTEEDWTALVKIYEDALRARAPSEQDPGMLVQIGQLYAQKLDDDSRAEEFFRRVRKADPTQRVMLDFYRGYYRGHDEPAKILALLDTAQRLEKDADRRLEIAREMAQVAEHDVANLDKAIDIWKGTLRLAPSDAEATAALKRLYRATHPPKWNALRELLKDEIDVLAEGEVDEKIALLEQIVEIYAEHLKLDVMVVNTYNAILDLRPEHQPSLLALTERYEQMGRWNDLINVLNRRKEVEGEVAGKIELLHRVVTLWLDKFGNHSQAIAPLEEVLSLDPLEGEALAKLRDIHQRRRNWRALIDLLRREADHRSGEERRALVQEMARVASERLGDAGEAIQVWNQLLEQDAQDAEALSALAELYRRQDRWAALAEVLHRQQVAEEDAERSLALLEQLGDIYTNRLRGVGAQDGSAAAIEVWGEVLQLRPEHPKALALLRELYVQKRRWDDLEQLFGERDQWATLAETLTNAADRSSESEIKIKLYSRVGQLCASKLENPERAVKAYERVLAVSPGHIETCGALAPLYRQTERWSRLLTIYETLLESAEELDQQLGLLGDIRGICEQQLGSRQLAFSWCARAYRLAPDDLELDAELSRLAEASEAWEELAQVYDERVSQLEDAAAKQALLRRVAELCVERLHRPEDAEKYHLALLEIDETDIEALEALEAIYSSRQRWADLVDMIERQAALADGGAATGDETVDKLFKVAFVQEERLADPAAAIETYARIAEVDPNDLRALRSLERLYHVRNEWSKLVEVLQQQLILVDEADTKVELLHGLGELYADELKDDGAAIDMLERALGIDPNHRPTALALEQHLSEEGAHRPRVAELLEPIYERAEDHGKLAGALEVLLESERDGDEGLSETARQLLRRLQALYDKRLGNYARARWAAEQLFAADSADHEARRDLARLAEQTEKHEVFARAVEHALGALEDDTALELALRWDLARTLDGPLTRPEDAEEHVRRIVELDPAHGDAFAMLERILRDKGKWQELRDVLHHRRDLSDDIDEKRHILGQICALNEDVLGDDGAAIEAYEQMLALKPSDEEAVRALERHYRDGERWPELAEFYGRRLDHAESGEAIAELKVRQAEVRARELGEVSSALDLLDEVVAVDAEQEGAVSLLELLLTEDEERRRITVILEGVYQRSMRWRDLVTVLSIRRELSEDRYEQVELLTRVARLSEEQIEDLQTAFYRYCEALRIEPGAVELQDAVKRLGEQLEQWEAEAKAWREALEVADADDVSLCAKLLSELARLQDERLEAAEDATASYQRLLELDPTNPETGLVATTALARLHEAGQDWRALVDVLRKQLDWVADREQRLELLARMGRIEEDLLELPEAAVESYVKLLEEDPTSAEALDALERLYVAAESWLELIAILKRRVDLAEQSEVRQQLWRRIAQLYEEQLEEIDETINAQLAVLEDNHEDAEALRVLARLYTDGERWVDLMEIIERQISLASPDSEERRERLHAAANLSHRHLHDLALAIERYREVLAGDPSHAGSREALAELQENEDYCLTVCEILGPLYRDEGDWDALIRVHEMQAERASSVGEKVELLRSIATIHEDARDDLTAAFAAYRRALVAAATEPELEQLIDTLLRVASATGDHEALVSALEGIANDVLDLEQRKRIHSLCARIARDELSDLARGEQQFRALLDIEPEHGEALEALEAIYQQTEAWDSLLEILSRRIELTDDDQTRVSLLVGAAELCRDQLERPDDAIASFERVREFDRDHGVTLDALDGLYAQTERWPDLADLLAHRAELCEDVDEQVELYFRLAELRAGQLVEPRRALTAYARLLEVSPSHAATVQQLEAYLDDMELGTEAARLLEPIYGSRQDWPNLIKIYEIRLAAAEEADDRLALMTRIAQLYEEQLEDLEGAFTWYGKVFLESPTDTGIRDQLTRLTGILDCWEALANVFTRYLDDNLAEDDTSREIALLVGHLYDEKLYTWQPAKENFERVLRNDPADEEAFRLLEQLLMRHEQWQELLELYRNTVDATLDSSKRRDLMFKIARVWEEALEDMTAAIDAYQQILDDDNDQQAVDALERLYRDTERWEDLCELINRRMDFIDDAVELIEMKFQLGMIYEEKLLNLGAAIDHYEEVLARDSSHPAAIGALEQLVMDREQRFRIAQILEPIYRNADEWAKLVVIYDAQLAFIEDADRRVFLLKEIARLHEERGGSLELAFRALCRAFEENPEDGETLTEAERLAGQLEMWKEIVELLVRCVDKTYDFDVQARLHTRVAQLLEDKLDNPQGAVDAWRRVLGVRDDDDNAMQSLMQLLELLERWPELVDQLRRKAELSPDVTDQQRAFERIAELYGEQLPDPVAAVEAWRQVLGLDPASGRALDALERLYTASEEWIELIWVYQRKLELTDDPELWRELQLSVAKSYEERLEDNFEAINALKAILERDDANAGAGQKREVLDALDRLYTREALWADLLEVVEAKADLADGDEVNGLRFRAGAILANEIGDLDGAIDRFERVVADDANNEPSTEALEKLLDDEGQRVRVALVLEGVYKTRGDVPALMRVMETRLTTIAEPPERRDVLVRIAELAEEGLEDQRAAFEAFGRALAEDPADERIHGELDRLGASLTVTEELVDLYAARLDEIYDMDLGRRLNLKLARMLEDVLEDDQRAEKHFRLALDAGGDELEPLEALDRVLERQQKWDDLLEVLERRVQAVTSPGEQAELSYRAGQIRQQQLSDVDGAFASYRGSLERDSTHGAAREAMEALAADELYRVSVLDVLEPLYEQAGDFAKVVELLRLRLTTLVDPIERLGLGERIAQLSEEQLDDRQAAFEAYSEALAEDPANLAVLGELERLAEALGAFEALAARADAILGADGLSEDALRELGLRAAGWHRDKLGQLEQAEAKLDRVRAVLPDCLEALEALEEIYKRGSRFEELAKVLNHRADLVDDSFKKRELLAEVARLREDALDDDAGAIESWRAVLDVDDIDRAALEALSRLHEQRQEWPELLDALMRLAPLADDASRQVSLRKRAAQVQRDQLEDLEGAIDSYRDVLDLEPRDEEALAGLEALQRQREDWPAVEEVLMRRLEGVEGTDRIELFEALADLSADMLDNVGAATGYLQQILDEDPRHEGAFTRLEALLRRQEQWYDLIEVLRKQAGLSLGDGDGDGAVRKLVGVARVWTDQLENPEAAAEVLEEVLQQDEGNVTALAELARLYETTQQWDKCLEVLDKAAALDPSPTEEAELQFRKARVLVERGGGDAATVRAHYERALELSPAHAEAAAALEALAREEGDWARVAELLEQRVASAEAADQLALLRELGVLYRDKLDQAERSVETWERARELAPKDTEVLVPLAEAYCGADRLDDAEPILAALVEASGNRRSKELARYLQLLGVVAERRSDLEAARGQYEKSYRIDSTSGPTLVALGRVYSELNDWQNARRIYRSMLLQNPKDDWGISRAEIFGNLGKIHAALGETAKAKSMLERGLEIEPDNATLRDTLDALD
jgi:tetratricopeptide (TPR) repeat protein